MLHASKTSKIAPELRRILLYDDNDRDLRLSLCQVRSGRCELSSGIEHLFVSMTAQKIVSHLRNIHGQIEFHELIYAPHTSVEKKCGYDLSVGYYKEVHRVRLMHKLLSGTYKGGMWIDEAWQWASRREGPRAKDQVRTLVRTYEETPTLVPFIVLHTCYCIHEYRRMGITTERDITVPPFEDYRRTVVVDLRAIQNISSWEDVLDDSSFELQIGHNPEDGRIEAVFTAGEVRKTLDIWSFAPPLGAYISAKKSPLIFVCIGVDVELRRLTQHRSMFLNRKLPLPASEHIPQPDLQLLHQPVKASEGDALLTVFQSEQR